MGDNSKGPLWKSKRCHRAPGWGSGMAIEQMPPGVLAGPSVKGAVQKLIVQHAGMPPCCGPECALFVADEGGDGICGDLLAAASLHRVAEALETGEIAVVAREAEAEEPGDELVESPAGEIPSA